MNLKEYLQNLGFSKIDIKGVLNSTNIRDVELISPKISYCKNYLGLTDKEVVAFVNKYPEIIGKSIKNMQKKMDFYKNLLNLDDKKLKTIVLRMPQILALNIDSDDKASVKGKIEFYKEYFGLDEKVVLNMIKEIPALLAYDTLSHQPTSVMSKTEFYKKELGITHQQFAKMVAKAPNLLSFDINSDKPTAVKAKLKYLTQIANKEEIVKNPKLFSFPATRLKVRFMILSTIYQRPRILYTNDLMTNEQKLWARKKHLEEIGKQKVLILAGERKFVKSTGASTEYLLSKYPLNHEAIENIEIDYFKSTGNSLKIDDFEKQELLS